jgi:uncharacterized protein (UPF0332 family)
MTGRDFIACATRLAQQKAEADLRSAVSRAYYGAFHESRDLLRDCGVHLPKTEQVHIKIVYCLQDCGDEVAEDTGQILESLRGQRKAADYDLDDSQFTSERKAVSEVARAKYVLKQLEQCRKSFEFRSMVRAQAKLLGLPVSD